jgi:hypothetical protein
VYALAEMSGGYRRGIDIAKSAAFAFCRSQ